MSLRDRAREAPTTVVNISALLGLVVNGSTCSDPVNADRMPERGAGEQPVYPRPAARIGMLSSAST
jgi:hypothetical protein